MSEEEDVIARLQQRILNFVRERDWEQFQTPKDMALSLSLEASEVLEHFQWKNEREVQEYLAKNKAAVGEELCDCLYWILLMAHRFGLDLEQAFEQKMQKNERKYPVEKVRGEHKKYTELDEEAS